MVRETPESAKPAERWYPPARREPHGRERQEDHAPDDPVRPLRPHRGEQGRPHLGGDRELRHPGFVRAAAGRGRREDRLRGPRPDQETKAFALNVLGKGQQALAFTFFKPAEKKGDTISGEPFRPGKTGAPILASTPAFIECSLETTVEMGDHSVFVGKVVEVGLAKTIDGRPDDATLWMKDLGDKVFYGG
jgi:flavin reductase like protein